MAHIFISYSKKDIDFARHLRELLKVEGFEVWMDEVGIGPGDAWRKRIEQNINVCTAFVIVMSQNARESKWVEREFLLAEKLNKRVFPVWLSDEPWWNLNDIQYADMRDGIQASLPPQMVYALEEVAPRSIPPPLPPPVPPPPEPESPPVLQALPPSPPPVIEPSSTAQLPPTDLETPSASQLPAPTVQEVTPPPQVSSPSPGKPVPQLVPEPKSLPPSPPLKAKSPPASPSPPPASPPPPVTPLPKVVPRPSLFSRFLRRIPTLKLRKRRLLGAISLIALVSALGMVVVRPQIAGRVGIVPIIHNADWTPVTQKFDGVDMVLVPTGCFEMGSNNGSSIEQPVNQQCFNQPFWMDRTEVTNAQFAALNGQAANVGSFTGANQPRDSMTWFEARDFCSKRGGRLPTEAEWEYAARGPDDLVYPWGNDFLADNVVYSGNSGSQSADVGSKPGGASWVGALDMAGNVYEWVSSAYQSYPYSATDGREDISRTDVQLRAVRGGSWGYTNESDLRAASRSWSYPYPTGQVNGIGLRCIHSY